MTSRSPARGDQSDPGPLADMLLRHRLTAGLSQRELADRSGLSERAVRDLERGATARPRRRSVQAVAATLGLHGDELTRFLAAALAGRVAAPGAAPVLSMSTVDGLVGRERELRQLADLLTGGRYRMLTVTGQGGVGKSRLVAELVAALRRQTGWDIRTLDLTGLAEPDLVGEAIAETLDAGSGSRMPPVERAAAAVRASRTGRVVLVLDRFEHVLAAAPVVGTIVRRCPGLSVLVTSQRRLHIGGERQFPVDPLPFTAAVQLFARRAAAISPGFALTEENTGAVTAICRAVDGLPLAVELAAARIRLMTPAELAARFGRQLRVLTGGAADLPPRHRSLRATIESSLEVVTQDGRTLFAWLGAFAGGGLLTDLEAVAASLGRDDDWLLAALGELVDTSLVRVRQTAGDSRYLMPDAMTELAREHLAPRADRDRVERAVATRFLQRVRRFAARPDTDDQRDADNVRTAVQYAIAHDICLLDPETIRALHAYYEVTGRPNEGRQLFLAAATAGSTIAYLYASKIARFQGDLPEAARLASRAMSLLDPADTAGLVEARLTLGAAATEAGDSKQARSHFRAVLVLARRAKDIGLIARALNNLGVLSAETGRFEDAERLFAAGLEARRRAGANELDIASSWFNLAEITLELGRYEQALARAEQAAVHLDHRLTAQTETIRGLALVDLGRKGLAREAARRVEQWLARPREEHRHVALIRLRCSVILAATGEPDAAAQQVRIALPTMLDGTKRYHDEAATRLEAHARLLCGRETERDAVTATQLLGAAQRLRQGSGRPLSAATASTLDTTVQMCRKVRRNNKFDREYRAGNRLSIAALAEVCARIASTP